MRVDHNFSASDTFFARYTIDNATCRSNARRLHLFPLLGSPREISGLRWRRITSSRLRYSIPCGFPSAEPTTARPRTNIGLPGGTGPQIVPGFYTGIVDMSGTAGSTYTEFGSVNAAPTTFNVQNIYTLSDDVNWTRGKHAFKFGVLLNRYNLGSQATNSFNGQLQYNQFSDFLQSIPAVVEFAPTFADENRFFIFNTYGLYGQDDWRVTQRLTVNLGLRYEFMNTPHELNNKQSRIVNDFTDPFTLGPVIQNNTLHDFSPRVGLAYDLFGNGKTAIRGGAGIYYDMGNIGTALGQTANGSLPYAGLVDILPPDAHRTPSPARQRIGSQC